MRPIEEWERSDLETLIREGVQESLTLDYKRSDALKRTDGARNELSKDVSAFANSAGGTLVYGVIEQDRKPIDIDGGCDTSEISREWIEQVLNSTIQPRIQGLIIKPIDLDSGRSAFAIQVPQATAFAPHQANDRRYYRRFNFESVPMHDYEIRDVLRRGTSPDLDLEWKMVRLGSLSETEELIAELWVRNASSEPAHYTAFTLDIVSKVDPELQADQFKMDKVTLRDPPGNEFTVHRFSRFFSIPGDRPIYKEEPFRIARLLLRPKLNALYFAQYALSCPGFSRCEAGYLCLDGAKLFGFDRVAWQAGLVERSPK